MRWSLVIALLVAARPAAAGDPPTPEQIEFFEKKVRPVLVEHCHSCHGEKKQNAGLRLDTAAGLKQGADNGAVVVAGDPGKSRLIRAINRDGDFPMPPKAALPPEAVAALTEWVKQGAVFPAAAGPVAKIDPKTHWAFQPVRLPPVPEGRNPIDTFVRAKLTDKGLSPAPPADKRTLLRRATFDLHGLPPTFEEITAFEIDPSPDAFEKVIDRLLASPRYGERWGRYWLDVARYADTKGYVFNEDRNYPFAYTYRDYVIRSFNEDKPFDRFVLEQLAADKLDLGDDKRPLAAMGFLTLGRRFLNNTHDIIDDRIDVVTRGLMGLTVGCARCHDHKYDPIPTKDYYSLYGVFASSVEPKDLPLIEAVKRTPEVIAFEADVEKREAEYQADVAKRHQEHLTKFRSAESITAYLSAIVANRRAADEGLQAYLRGRDLSPFVFNRWKAFLAEQQKLRPAVFGPLVALAALPAAEFEVLARVYLNDPETPANPLVYRALVAAKPKSIEEVCAAYGRLLADHGANLVGPPSDEERELTTVFNPGGPTDIPVSDFAQIQNRADRDALAKLRQQIEAFKAKSPAAPARAMVLADAPAPTQPVVFLRGNPGNRGPSVPRQFPEILAGPDRKPFAGGSGRLELAKAIASPDNPLTARVFVNRVWLGHFGQGLVRTPSDFGLRSEPPTHPELLDWLATRFVQDGWSMKKLHKRIMLSATYQQSSNAEFGARSAEPKIRLLGFAVPSSEFRVPSSADVENRLLARQNRRRLDFEALRDSLLFATGKLDLAVGGKPVDLFKAPFTTRRTVYGFLERQNLPGTFRVFDMASPDQHSPQRFQTTVPQQALFLMNSPFVIEQAKAVVGRKEVAEAGTDEAKITRLYRIILGRDPTVGELNLGREFVETAAAGVALGPWEQYAQVLLVSNEFAFVD